MPKKKPVDLHDVLPKITLPGEVDLSVLDAQPQPQCTPSADIGKLKVAAGVRDVQAMMASVYNPSDLAAIGALVHSHALAADVTVQGSAVLQAPQTGGGPRCVAGSLHVQGDLDVGARLVVCGDLRVDGLLHDGGPDSTIVVLGNLHVGALQTTGEIWVLGSLAAQRYVWGHYNDNVLEVAGVIRAPLVLSSDHAIEGSCEVEHAAPPNIDEDSGEAEPVHVFDLWDAEHQDALRLVTPAEVWTESEDEEGVEEFNVDAFERFGTGA